MNVLKIVVCYVGSSLLAPLKQAEREIERAYALGLQVAAYNFGAPLDEAGWRAVERDLGAAQIVFVIHVTDGENAARLIPLLEKYKAVHRAVVVLNCMPDLMRRTRMGRLRFGREAALEVDEAKGAGAGANEGMARRLVGRVGAWMGEQARSRRASGKGASHTQYLRYIERLPALLRVVPNAGRLRDAKIYLSLFCYFLQPTPANIRAMLLLALKSYAADKRLDHVELPPPESMPAVAIYHPDAPALFESFAAYRAWYERRAGKSGRAKLDPYNTIGLLLMRPQIVSGARAHYDALIRAVEAEGLATIPAISTFMDNREACEMFFVEKHTPSFASRPLRVTGRRLNAKGKRASGEPKTTDNGQGTTRKPRVSQIVSLTGFSFVGGPAMNDSEAAVEFLRELNVPFRSAVSLDVQTIEAWRDSWTGLNPVQAGMQIAIPEIDGATEPFGYGGMSGACAAPLPLEDRCLRIARRLAKWNRLQTAPRAEIKLALVVFCFPPNKGNIGTAADLDVFPSLWEMLSRLQSEGYTVEVPSSADELRERLLTGNSGSYGATANVAYRMTCEEYRRLCPFAREIEAEWGTAPGAINSFGGTLLVQGLQLGNVFVGVQPTFGYEGDPLKMLMARGGAPHHGFAAFYAFIEKVFRADSVAHVGTHGALEFMPGKQVGLSESCWPDRLIGELPNIYIYSVNNPSEGSIARRRSYAELISYLTPPVEDAGVYSELASLKELLLAYRQTTDEGEREQLYELIDEKAASLHFAVGDSGATTRASR
ncbi:MAG TPA: cobaltochelatase subunit CobN [Pyrinomonadaceae bacterium]|nr:cobaltochelatase subunit CobN [Pyrinomonadaceae bacterium]